MDRAALEAEALRIIERGEIDPTVQLSRRHRWKPLALDITGDLGTVLIAVRGKRVNVAAWAVTYDLMRESPSLLRSSGLLRHREPHLPVRPSFVVSRRPASSSSSTSFGGMWSAMWLLVAEAHTYEVRGERYPVADHGYIVAAGRGRRGPPITVFDAVGRNLGILKTGPPGRVLRTPIRRTKRLPEGSWFNYAPRR